MATSTMEAYFGEVAATDAALAPLFDQVRGLARGAGQVPGGPHSVRVTVNGQPVELPDREMTGLEIKDAAIEPE